MYSVGDVVFAPGFSAILGDIVSIDKEAGVVVVCWRETTTMEPMDDIELVGKCTQTQMAPTRPRS
jgi:hypothetical protein